MKECPPKKTFWGGATEKGSLFLDQQTCDWCCVCSHWTKIEVTGSGCVNCSDKLLDSAKDSRMWTESLHMTRIQEAALFKIWECNFFTNGLHDVYLILNFPATIKCHKTSIITQIVPCVAQFDCRDKDSRLRKMHSRFKLDARAQTSLYARANTHRAPCSLATAWSH